MAKNTTPYFYKEERKLITTFVNADGNNFKQIASAGADGSHVSEILISSTDTAARVIAFWSSPDPDAANVVSLGFPLKMSVNIAVGVGATTLAPDPIRLVNANSNFIQERLFDRDQNYIIKLPAGHYLFAQITATPVTSGAGIWVKTQVIISDF